MSTTFRRMAVALLVMALSIAACAPITPVPPAATAPSPSALESPLPADLAPTHSAASPEGDWIAETYAYFPPAGDRYYQRLTVRRADGAAVWTPVDTWSPMGLGYTVPVPIRWAEDAQALYYTNLPNPDGCVVMVDGLDLWRLDLNDGSAAEFLPPVGLSLALSSDTSQVAYIAFGTPVLVLHDLASGGERRLSLTGFGDERIQAGRLVWSPSGDAVALAIAHDPCAGGWAASTTVLQVDATTLATDTLLDQDPRLLSPVAWPAPDTLLLEDRAGARYTLDLGSGSVAPTP